MKLSMIILAVFLILFGCVTAFALSFKYAGLIIGVLAIAAGIFLFARA